MRNVIISIAVGAAVFARFFFSGLLRLGESVVPGVLALMVAYFVLARRTFKRVEGVFNDATKFLHAMPPKLDLAISEMEKAYSFSSHQFGVRSQIDSQVGMLRFAKQDFNGAMPVLQRSLTFGHWMGGAMLGVIHYKKKNHDEMRKTFEIVTKRAKKQSLPWNLYAYLLCQIGERDKAQQVLTEALKKTDDDEKVQTSLLALQNGKKIKMKVYKDQWYQFHLERPPAKMMQSPIGGRVSAKERRGRW